MSTVRTESCDLVVIGGGPAGMFAAITAAETGRRVVLLEKNERLGRKLLITGKGRCNVTNNCPPEEVLKNVLRNPQFLYSSVYRFPPERVINFFEERNCALKTERGNRVFPQSDRSADILSVLEDALARKRVVRRCERALSLRAEDGRICAVLTDKTEYQCGKAILATGGVSYSATGSTGDGYALAAALGHTVQPQSGSLVPLESADEFCAELQGLSLRNVALRLIDAKGKTIYSDFGEMLFTHFGISGPTVLSASAHICPNETYRAELDLKPALDEETLNARILRDVEKYKNRSMENALVDLYPHALIPVILRKSGILPGKKANSLTKEERRALLLHTKHFSISVCGTRPIAEAIVTRGGVNVRQINPTTMESRLVRGLYFAGEILDCDAYTGGFNLQIAWATAYAAGTHCFEETEKRE